jgi:hypothetical protein
MTEATRQAVNAYDDSLDEFFHVVEDLHEELKVLSAPQTEALEQTNKPDIPRALNAAQDYVWESRFPSLLEMAASLA